MRPCVVCVVTSVASIDSDSVRLNVRDSAERDAGVCRREAHEQREREDLARVEIQELQCSATGNRRKM